MQATRAAKKSRAASGAATRLAKTSIDISKAARVLFEKAHAQRPESFLQFASLYLYGKLQLALSRWLMGRSMQLMERARAQLRTSRTILDSLGVKRDA
jgi:hypothetical protein